MVFTPCILTNITVAQSVLWTSSEPIFIQIE